MTYTKFNWVNKETIKFLSNGYLTEGETVESRTKDICNTAENILGFEGFSSRFFSYVSRGWVSFSSPVWANFGKRGLPISCLAGNSWINTYKEGGKQIEEIEVGDLVLTHKGRYRKVLNKQVRMSSNDMYELKVNTRLTPIKITGNHPVLTNMGWVRVDELDENLHWIATNRCVEHEPEDHIIYFNNIVDTTNEGRFQPSAVKSILVDEDFAWALGLWFAEGSLSTSKGKPNGIRITLNSKEVDVGQRWANILCNKTGLNSGLYKSEVKRNNQYSSWLSINVNSIVLGDYFKREFGNSCKTKNIPVWVKQLPTKLIEKFLEGFYLGDGKKVGNTMQHTISNPRLTLSIYELSLRCGKRVGLQMQEKAGRLATTSHVYRVTYYSDSKRSKTNVGLGIDYADGLRYCPFSIKKLDTNELVYDITVEEDHSFSVSGVVVHNCYGSFIEDTMESILYNNAEIGMMTKQGGGTSLYLNNIRPRGSKISTGGEADGPIHFAGITSSIIERCKQSDVRRGACAVYLDITHPDLPEMLRIGQEGADIQNLQYGVCVSDEFLQSVEDGDKDNRKIWASVLRNKIKTGFPYIFFTDTVNNKCPDWYKESYKISFTNLCSEIMLPASEDESFVCCLSSVNLFYFNDWKDDANFIEDMIFFLDSVMTEFIEKSGNIKFMERAHTFAKRHRALGLGVLGWHSYLQQNMVPIESLEAQMLNKIIFKNIRSKADIASSKLAEIFGSPELLLGTGKRNSTVMAVAPTKSSSYILEQISLGIEPIKSNYLIKDLAKIKEVYKNPVLEKFLDSKGLNTKAIWLSILDKDGSVQHLDELTQEEKNVFKTAMEVSQMELVRQNADRQKFVDQGISFNLFIHPDTPFKDINKLYMEAWKLGLKSIYYQISENSAQAFSRDINNCVACES